MIRAPYSFRSDKAVPAFPDDKPIIVFDGNCVLCSGFAQFVLKADTARRFRLMAAQTPLGAALYRHYGLAATDYESNILIEDGIAWIKSEGSLRIAARLGLPWSLLAAARVLPLRLRDRLYEVVARNRLKWFGVRQSCFMPDAAEADRFLG